MSYPTTPPGDDPTSEFGAPPMAEPPPYPPAPPAPEYQAAPAYQAAPEYPAAPPASAYPTAPPAQAYPTAYPTSTWQQAAPPVAPKRSMTWLWVTIAVVAVVAVLAVGAVGVVLLARAGGDGGASATSPTGEPKATAEPTAEPTDEAKDPAQGNTLEMPDTVGGLKKSENPAFAGLTDQVSEQMEGVLPDIAHVGVALYDDPDSAMGFVMVMRMDMDVIGSTAGAVDGAFGSLGGMGKVSGTRTVKPPAPLTGPGKCGNVTSQGVQMAICVAADDHTVSMAMFMERQAKEVGSLFNKIRLDIVP